MPASTTRWLKFLRLLYRQTADADLFSRAAQAAFYFSFALFPALFFLTSVLGLVLNGAADLKAETYEYLRELMPGAASELVRRTIEEIVVNSSGSKLAIGLIIALWSASAGVDGIRGGLNAVYDIRERRSWFRTKVQSLLLTLAVTSLAIIVLAIVFYGWQLIQHASAYIGIPITSPVILVVIQWLSIVLLMLLAFELIFNLLPDFRKFKWDWITPGSVVAIILWLILSSLFKLYIAFFTHYDRTYGSLAAVIILMLWLYLLALVVMIGGAINSVKAAINSEKRDEIGPVTDDEGTT